MAKSVIMYFLVLSLMVDYCTSVHITFVTETKSTELTEEKNYIIKLEDAHRIAANIEDIMDVSTIDSGMKKVMNPNSFLAYKWMFVAIKLAVIIIAGCLVYYQRKKRAARQSICENVSFEEETTPKKLEPLDNYSPTYDYSYMSNYFSSPSGPCPCHITHFSTDMPQQRKDGICDEIQYYTEVDEYFIGRINAAEQKKNRCESLSQNQDPTQNKTNVSTITDKASA